MKIAYKQESRNWAIYFATILISVYIHEVGHCIPAWIHGFRAIPTPAKEYTFVTIPKDLQQYISLGGIIGSVLISLSIITLYILKQGKLNNALLAGAIALPGMYSFLCLIKGRGHDGTEFQEAQAAMGLSYSGHSIDWIFFILFLGGALVWYSYTKPGTRIIKRIVIGLVVTLFFIGTLQSINNQIFDPIFLVKPEIGK